MQKYLLSRFLQAVLILLGVLVIVFFMVRIAGDPVNLMVPREASDEYREEFRHMMGYDRPLLVQLGDFMSKAVLGDFGNSLHFKEPAMPMVIHRLPATLELAGVGMIMAIVIAIPIGLIGGFRPGTWIDYFWPLPGLTRPEYTGVLAGTLVDFLFRGRTPLAAIFWARQFEIHHPSGFCNGLWRHGCPDSPHTLCYPGNPGGRLCADRPQQGPAAQNDLRQACPSECVDPAGERHWRLLWLQPGWFDLYRNHIRLAWDGTAAPAGDWVA